MFYHYKSGLSSKNIFFLDNNYSFTLLSINRRTNKNISKNYELYTEVEKSQNVEK